MLEKLSNVDAYINLRLRRYFEFELYVRHAYINNKEAINSLRNIRIEIIDDCIRTQNTLDADNVADDIFDLVHNPIKKKEILENYLQENLTDEYEEDIKIATTIKDFLNEIYGKYGKKIRDIACQLKWTEKYYLSSLSWESDIKTAFLWWKFITNKENRKLHKLQGKYGHTGSTIPEENTLSIDIIHFPCKVARIIPTINIHNTIYDTSSSEIIIDGITQHNKLILSIDICKENNSYDRALQAFSHDLGLAFSLLNISIFSDENIRYTDETPVFPIKKNIKVLTENSIKDLSITQINSYFHGIMCWDAVNNGSKIEDAVKSVLETINESTNTTTNQDHLFEPTRKHYFEINKRIKKGKTVI